MTTPRVNPINEFKLDATKPIEKMTSGELWHASSLSGKAVRVFFPAKENLKAVADRLKKRKMLPAKTACYPTVLQIISACEMMHPNHQRTAFAIVWENFHESLRDFIMRRQPEGQFLTPIELLSFARQMVLGLHQFQINNYPLENVCLENIKVSYHGSGKVLFKIGDFFHTASQTSAASEQKSEPCHVNMVSNVLAMGHIISQVAMMRMDLTRDEIETALRNAPRYQQIAPLINIILRMVTIDASKQPKLEAIISALTPEKFNISQFNSAEIFTPSVINEDFFLVGIEPHHNTLIKSGDAEALFQAALILYGRKRYQEAFELGVVAADKNHARAKWLVGLALLTSNGCFMNTEAANRHFAEAAQLGGHPNHLGSLGILLKRATAQFELLIKKEQDELISELKPQSDRSASVSLRIAYDYMFATGRPSSPQKAYTALLSANIDNQSDPYVKVLIGILSVTFNKSDYLDRHVCILHRYEPSTSFTNVKLVAKNGYLGRTYTGFVGNKTAILVEPPIKHQSEIVALLKMCIVDPHRNNVIAPISLTVNVDVKNEERRKMPIALCYLAPLDAKPVDTAMIENMCKFSYYQPGVIKHVRHPQQMKIVHGNVLLLVNLMLGVAKGLAYLHRDGMPHGDVSLHNMYVDTQNKQGMIATKPYFSWQRPRTTPETLKGIEPYTIDSDIFEFAATFVNMLTKDYWRTKVMNSVATLEAAAATGYQDVRAQIPKWCPVELVDVLLRCLSLDSLQRPTMQRVVEMLDKLVISENKKIALDAEEKTRLISEFKARFFPKTNFIVGQRHQKGDARGDIYFEPNLLDPNDHRVRNYIFEKRKMPKYPEGTQQCSGESSECRCEREARPQQPRLITGTPAKQVKRHMGRSWGILAGRQLSWIGLFLNKDDRIAVVKALNLYGKFSWPKAAALTEEKHSEEAVKYTVALGA